MINFQVKRRIVPPRMALKEKKSEKSTPDIEFPKAVAGKALCP